MLHVRQCFELITLGIDWGTSASKVALVKLEGFAMSSLD